MVPLPDHYHNEAYSSCSVLNLHNPDLYSIYVGNTAVL